MYKLAGSNIYRTRLITQNTVSVNRLFSHLPASLNNALKPQQQQQTDQENLFVAPSVLAKESQVPKEKKDISHAQKAALAKGPLLSDNKYESLAYKLPKWKETIGEFVISALRLDMDKIRAGPIAGSYYYGLCKEQGLIKKDDTNEGLSKTASYWYDTLGLSPTFEQWFQITMLHTWILFVRMRAMPFKYGKNYQQKLVDRFFRDMELRLTNEMNVFSGRIRDQYLKEFHNQLRGAVLAYDEGFVTDDTTLAYAVWRNLFNAKQDVDYVALESVVRYIRMQLYVLSKLSDREFGFGKFSFVAPDEVVYRLTEEEEQKLKKKAYEEFEPADRKLQPSERSKLTLEDY